MREFTSNQKALFDAFDKDGDGTIEASEILTFLGDNLVKDVDLAKCKEIIAEFDSNADGKLDFDEFLNIFLPASDYNLRHLEFNPDPRGASGDGLPSSVPSMAARILEREIGLHAKRAECHIALAKETEETLGAVFNQIAGGRLEIAMTDLIWFCERYGFFPNTEDLEAILRRCDHDADRCINFEEFVEIVGHDYKTIMAARDERLENLKKEREAELEKLKIERELEKAEFEKKLELEKLEREKRLDEARAEAEVREAERRKQLEQWQLEREAEIQKAREAEEARRKEIEAQLEVQKAEREQRIAEAQAELQKRREEREAEIEKLRADREAAWDAQRKEAELRRAEYEK